MAIKIDRNDDLDKLFESFAVDPKAKEEVELRQATESIIQTEAIDIEKDASDFIKSEAIDDVRSNNQKIIK
ncbi:hypothetical protein HOY36_06645 [Enterococcus sp. MMGLQ5-2]|nr:hypothetical protein [Enterococcus sp. MMGLQ5-2]MBS7584696.1 hypothetical protein [Enterococcus sp. MMGLQ5-1]NPD12551.1 hypothetical protein [Enterococcus sp. MMGLQ5-1]NPD37045.1 hypothetical protein [Enterococcus sp. MMGLQ5-2]